MVVPPADLAPRQAEAMTPPSPPQTTVTPRSAKSSTDLLGHLGGLRRRFAGAYH